MPPPPRTVSQPNATVSREGKTNGCESNRKAKTVPLRWLFAVGIAGVCVGLLFAVVIMKRGTSANVTVIRGPSVALDTVTRFISSPYSAEYKAFPKYYISGPSEVFEVTVKGPAGRLAVILTDPKGKSEVRMIQKEEMITNSRTVELLGDPQLGTWRLAVKTLEPEKIVWQKDIPFSEWDKLTVVDVEAWTERDWDGKRGKLTRVAVVLKRTGGMPNMIDFDLRNYPYTWDGKSAAMGPLLVDIVYKEDLACVVLGNVTSGLAAHYTGERHSVRGTFVVGEERAPLHFSKDIVIPGPPSN
jgi:hypothetical protein